MHFFMFLETKNEFFLEKTCKTQNIRKITQNKLAHRKQHTKFYPNPNFQLPKHIPTPIFHNRFQKQFQVEVLPQMSCHNSGVFGCHRVKTAVDSVHAIQIRKNKMEERK